jgi:hypothetical protein
MLFDVSGLCEDRLLKKYNMEYEVLAHVILHIRTRSIRLCKVDRSVSFLLKIII